MSFDRPLRIGMMSPYSLTMPGGVQGQILGLARAVRSMGHPVRVLGPCDGPPPEPFVTPLGNSVPTGANGSVAPIAPDPAAQLRTIRALRDEDFDVLHLHEPLAPGPTTTAMLMRPAPIVATFHAAGKSLAYNVFRPLTSRGSQRIARRFAVSEDARELAVSALGGQYEICFNGIEVSAYRNAPRLKTDGPTVFFVARHEERKGLAQLLEAFRTLPADACLWVGGHGPESAALQSAYAHDARISWLGELGESEKMRRMASADVFCAPSLHGESFGIVLLEAMAAGTAVVASELSGYSRVARQGREAALVPPGDVARLSSQLRALLVDADARARLVAAGSTRVEQFSMQRLASIYIDAYHDALNMGS